MNGKNDLSLYIHVPFCAHKCPYCHFYSLPISQQSLDSYLEALLAEIKLRENAVRSRNLISLYFGGGTPFLFAPERLERVFSAVQSIIPIDGAEITLEANPDSINLSWLKKYQQLGINRLSLGVQSFYKNELEFLQRRHTPEDSEKAIFTALEAGISNISIDLMYELPSQTMEAWNYSLRKACSLPVNHLSLYNFMIEEPSLFFRKKEALEPLMPGEELSKEMYELLLTTTREHGFNQYEISAFAKNNLYSRHNVGYWTGRDFLGFGPSAFSFFEGKRFSNVSHLSSYCSHLHKGLLPINFVDNVSFDDRRKELLTINLRMNEGVHLDRFQKKWGKLDAELHATLCWLETLELLRNDNGTLKLTDRGRLVYDRIASELV